MATRTHQASNQQASRRQHADNAEKPIERFDKRFQIRPVLAERGLELTSLSPDELHVLEQRLWERLSPILDKLYSFRLSLGVGSTDRDWKALSLRHILRV